MKKVVSILLIVLFFIGCGSNSNNKNEIKIDSLFQQINVGFPAGAFDFTDDNNKTA
jgi:PBP1b-binding outer membrane lipoprotein LpoB